MGEIDVKGDSRTAHANKLLKEVQSAGPSLGQAFETDFFTMFGTEKTTLYRAEKSDE